ncbi:hypothetical protein MLD38_026338 [Melastoma candidum]|uniref:Uncharacterized protein n=1 Tax=Melastoma candidum TaxID=119954 RepID=A0ACB9NZ71_9MYRT|nr:hypothetical protein MLD38_026338 [Melastoma candidum]
MGVLHRRGSHAILGLLVGHVPKDITEDGLRDKEAGEPLWGKRARSNNSEVGAAVINQKSRLSYGSIVSFEAAELDPRDPCSGSWTTSP